MRLAAIILCGLCLIWLAPPARAQIGPGGIFNALTSPLRGALGVLGARPRHHHASRRSKRARAVQQKATPAAAAPVAAAAGAAAISGVTPGVTSAPPAEAAPAATASVSPADTAAPAPAAPETKPQPDRSEAKASEPKAGESKAAESKTYWPGAHEDLIGYIFWPRDYDEKLWAHGFAEILSAVFVPAVTRTASADTAANATEAETSKLCGPQGDSADWPNGRVAETLRAMVGDAPPTQAQQAAIEGLQKALGEALKAVRSACADIVSAPPAARMQTMLDRLWAIRVAGYLVREPLKTFYASLDGEQKKKFERGITDTAALDICAAASTAKIPFPLLERTIRPTAEQRKSIAALQRKVEQASQSLRASCPLKPPATPIARLDAALDRVDAITYAAGNLAPAFGEFYASLNEVQRNRLSELAR
ncbi:MAG TPA: Spy/CpxP family protein refolding chaperone [Pseudorhodoplanes sp.]|nr:Spy/CpxP family protein refolding chaperone [Pseudorhodoplanes sp.]